MKIKITVLLALLFGMGLGWWGGSYQAHHELKEMKESWSPEFRDLVVKSVAVGKAMSEEERQTLLKSALELKDKKISDWNSQAYGKAFQSLLIKKLLENGEVEAAMSSTETCLKRFVKLYDQGEFHGDINEEQASTLAEAIKAEQVNGSSEF